MSADDAAGRDPDPRRYRCADCSLVWRPDTSQALARRATLPKTAIRWALEVLVVQKLTVAWVADALDASWHTANDAVLAEGRRVLISNPARLEEVRVLGVDEHAWRHTPRRQVRHRDQRPHPVRDRNRPARLLGMVEGHSKSVFKDWLPARPYAWRASIVVVAMDGFSGFKAATAEEMIPESTAVMDPFRVVRPARRRARPLPTPDPAAAPRPPRTIRRPALLPETDTQHRR